MTEAQAREAALEQAMQRAFISDAESRTNREYITEIFDAGVEYANRWTYCEDALPKGDGDYEVTVYCNFGKRTFVHWSMWGGKWDIEGESFSYKVIAWRELPEPAKR